jgi:hypothetical protein
LSPEDVHKQFGLHPQSTEVMPGGEDSVVLPSIDSESLDKKFEEAI